MVEIFTTGLLSVVLLLLTEKELSTQGIKKKRNGEKVKQKQNKQKGKMDT